MDSRAESMQRAGMRDAALLLACAVVLGGHLGCGSSTPPAESAERPVETEAVSAPAEEAQTSKNEADPAPAQPAPVATTNAQSIPDSHDITNGDCDALGSQLATATRADQVAALDAKLSAAQRSQAQESIDAVSRKVGEKWTETCRRSLVGGATDGAALKCALRAKTVKAFDECLNGPPVPASK